MCCKATTTTFIGIFMSVDGIANYNIDYVNVKEKNVTFIIVNDNNYNNDDENYTENAKQAKQSI